MQIQGRLYIRRHRLVQAADEFNQPGAVSWDFPNADTWQAACPGSLTKIRSHLKSKRGPKSRGPFALRKEESLFRPVLHETREPSLLFYGPISTTSVPSIKPETLGGDDGDRSI